MLREPRRKALFGVGLMLIAAGGAALAQVQSGAYDSGNAGSLSQNSEPGLLPDAAYRVGAYPSFPAGLAAGEGQSQTESFCAQCHSTRYITMQPPLPAAAWEAEVNKMIKTYGAPIPESAAKKIISYLQSYYTIKTRK